MIDPPWRFDPFQNPKAVNWGGSFYVAFFFGTNSFPGAVGSMSALLNATLVNSGMVIWGEGFAHHDYSAIFKVTGELARFSASLSGAVGATMMEGRWNCIARVYSVADHVLVPISEANRSGIEHRDTPVLETALWEINCGIPNRDLNDPNWTGDFLGLGNGDYSFAFERRTFSGAQSKLAEVWIEGGEQTNDLSRYRMKTGDQYIFDSSAVVGDYQVIRFLGAPPYILDPVPPLYTYIETP